MRITCILRFLVIALLSANLVFAPHLGATLYCDDIPVSCEDNVVGWQKTCGPLCEACGPKNCPQQIDNNNLPLLTNSTCRTTIIERQNLTGCDNGILSNGNALSFASTFTPACNERVICYHTSNYTKEHCDSNFEGNAIGICRSLYSVQAKQYWWLNELNKATLENCLAAAKIWIDVTSNSGRGVYNNAQDWNVKYCPL